MNLIRTSILLVAFIATVYGQFTLGPYQVKFGIPLRLGGNRAVSNQNGLTSTMINIQNTIRNLYSKYGNTIAVTNQLMRQYKFNLPGYSTYQQKYNAVKQYVDCTLSKPKGTYINGVQDCQANSYAPSNHQPTYHQPATIN